MSAVKGDGSSKSGAASAARPSGTGSRTRALTHPVTITLDGDEILAERGEPVAAALVAAGKLVLARSPKFHRPRGPSCMRAACDGCLARVDENPNVMTCLAPAEEGTAVVTQNRLGPRETDLLRMADWFFPEGMNHHELFAGIPGVQGVMQAFARRVAGLGKLPAEGTPPRPAKRRKVDVVIVGGGPSGMAIATRAARAGRAVEILDDQLALGGAVLALGPRERAAFDPLVADFTAEASRGRVRVRPSTCAGGMYGRDLLVVGPEGAEVLEAASLVLACGAHDGILAFEGNDVPGVMSARAAGLLLSHGVLVGKKVVVVVPPGGGPFGESYAAAVPGVTLVRGEPVVVKGSSRVKAVVVRDAASSKTSELPCDALLVDAPRSPAYELAEQVGATLAHEPRGYRVVAEGGRIADGLFVAGELSGVAFEPNAIATDADRVVASMA